MDYRVKPWAHQLGAIELAKGRDHFALFFEQGCGKTSTCINIIRQETRCCDYRLILILCPGIVVENWRREWLTHSFLSGSCIYTLIGSAKERLATLRLSATLPSRCDRVIITNYESLLMPTVREALTALAPDTVVLDESHLCKNPSAKRTKYAIKLSRKAKYRYILTGTPTPNSLEDIFSQFLFLDQGESFGASFFGFRKEYFIDRNANRPKQNYFPDWVPKADAAERINEKIFKKAVRVKKSECLDLPPFIRQFVFAELSKEQRQVYQDLERDAVAVIQGGGIVSADLAIKKLLRLQQVVTGFVKTDELGTIRTFCPNPRIDALSEVIDSIATEHKIIVWAVFKQNYEDIRRLMYAKKLLHAEIHGQIPQAERQAHIDAFNNPSSPVRVLLAHPASAGTGVNLTGASYSIFYSRGFSLEHDLQAEARNYRGGSEIHEKITRIDILAPGTVDEVVLAALSDKADVAERVLKHIKDGKVSND